MAKWQNCNVHLNAQANLYPAVQALDNASPNPKLNASASASNNANANFNAKAAAQASLTAPKNRQNTHNTASDSVLNSKPGAIRMGFIIPKKCYPLAVDRNRIRRVGKALLLKALLNKAQTSKAVNPLNTSSDTLQILVRFKPLAKTANKSKRSTITQAFSPQSSAQNTPQATPQSKRFAQGLETCMNAALAHSDAH